MKNLIISLLMLAICKSCYSQVEFKEFANMHKTLDIPIVNILSLAGKDTLNGRFTNDIIIRNQLKRPQYVDKYGNLKTINQYYGLYPEEPDGYLKDVKNETGKWEEKRFYFLPKIVPIGRIHLNDRYISIIIKVISYETTFYDLWNFSKDGEALSVVCLFWGLRDEGPRDEKVTFTIVDSKITKEGNIIWHENADGLETFRTYKLNDEGYFQVTKEEQRGEIEF